MIKDSSNRNRFFDCSLIPNPQYYGKSATLLQIETLEKLSEINKDGTVICGFMNKSEKDILEKALRHDEYHSRWHCR